MTFRFDKLTIKAQEAVGERRRWRPKAAIRRSSRCTCWRRCWTSAKGSSRPLLEKIGAESTQLNQHGRSRTGAAAQGLRWRARPNRSTSLRQVLRRQPQAEADRMKDEFVSTEHLLLALAKVESPSAKPAGAERRA